MIGNSKKLLVATLLAVGATGLVVWLDAGKCNGFGDWAEHAFFFYEDDTVWAEGYSEEGFRKIVPGMTGEDVVRLVGRPLYEWWGGEGTECLGRNMYWDYARCDLSGWVRRVYFDEYGRTVAAAVQHHWAD